MAMDTKDIRTDSVLTAPISDGNGGFNDSSNALQTKRNKSYQDIGSNSLGKVESQGTRPCAIIGPDRVLPPPPASDVYLKKASVEPWSCSENVYRPQTDFAPKLPEYQQVRNISPRQTFQENMQRIMVPPTYNSNKNVEDPNSKSSKDAPLEVKYCEVPYPVNHMINGQKSIRNPDIPITSVNPAFARAVPLHGWPNSASARPVRPFGAPEYYQYPEFANYAHPRSIPRPLRTAHHDPAQVSAEHLYHEGNVRFKPYPTLKDRYPQPRYEYGNGYPNQFHPHTPYPTQKFDLPKNLPPHAYPMYSQVPMRRIAEPMLDSYQRSNQPANFNPYHNQYIPPPYGPVPGNCIPNKMYPHPSDLPTKPVTSSKLPYDINNKIYLEYENNINKMYPSVDNMYYRDVNRQHLSKSDVAMPVHPGISMQYNVPPQFLYRKDNMPMKPFDSLSYRGIDPNVHDNSPLLRHPMQYPSSGLVISPADSNASNETLTTLGNLQEDCGYVSQSSTASGRSIDSGNYRLQTEILRKHESFYNSNIKKYSKQISRSDNSDKKGLNVRQFLQMWNEGEEEAATDSNNASTNHYATNSETISNQEQLYVLGLVNIPSEELSKYEHIQKISKLPENIKGYNSIELLDQYEQLVELPAHKHSKMNNLLDYQVSPKAVVKPSPQVPRPVSPLDVEAKISQSVIHKEVGCNFEIKPCSPKMLNADVATPAQNIIDERAIEKVMNLGLTNSSVHSSKPENITSCKMDSPYVPNSDAMKSNNYSFQELESNSGICLASLPRLDSDIELSFPEINQQFIDANRLNTSTNCDDVRIASSNVTTNTDVLECNIEKESSKLSKYRKNKGKDLLGEKVHPSVVNRTDSVIIKNPDNIRNQEELITNITTIADENEDNRSNIEYHDVGASQYESILNNSLNNNEETNIALDFSLNKITGNDKNDSECINLPDLNTGIESQENHQTNIIDSHDSIKTRKISNENNEEIDNHDSEYSNGLCSGLNNPEGISDQNVSICTPTDNITKNDTNILLNEHVPKDDEDHLKSIEEEVENIKLQLPSLCENITVNSDEIQQLRSNGNNEEVEKINDAETIHERSENARTVIGVTNSCTAENNSFTTHHDVNKKKYLNEISVVNTFLEEPNIPKQSSKQIIDNDRLKQKAILKANIDFFSCVNETKKELAALANKTLDTSIISKYEDVCPSKDLHQFECKYTDEYNGTQTEDFFVQEHMENEVITEGSVVAKGNIENNAEHVQTNEETLKYDDSTASHNNHDSVRFEENLKQETLPETEDKCIEGFQDNNKDAAMSPIVMEGSVVTSSTCSSIIENLITESSCDEAVVEENINRKKHANTINEILKGTEYCIERESYKLEQDSQENISSQMLEIQDFIEEIKADMSSPIMDIEPDYEFVPSEEQDEISIYTNNNEIPEMKKYFYKEYYSPRLQNLFLYHEGVCSSIVKTYSTVTERIIMKSKNEIETTPLPITENRIHNSIIVSNSDTKNSEEIDVIQTLEESYMVEADSCDSENMNDEEIEKLDNNVFQETEILYIHQDEFSNQSTNKDTLNENFNTDKDNVDVQLNRRLTLKRSLSDSAIELYNGTGDSKEQLDVNRPFLSKRPKIIPNDTLDHESEEFCSIVQNNRRNSISFCNSQNVFILIDNEYVIEEGDEDSEKICFTEVPAEFCSEADPVLNLCVSNNTEDDLMHEINTPDCLDTNDQSFENKSVHDAWDMNSVETIFNDDVAQDIIISAPTSPGNLSLEPNEEPYEEESVNSDSENEHMVRIREIYGDTMCTGDVQLVETLYNTPQMDVNKTLVDIESQNIQETLEDPLHFIETRSPARCFSSNNRPLYENQNQSFEVECNMSNPNEVNNCDRLKRQVNTDSDCVVDSGDFRDNEYLKNYNKENDLSDSLPSSPEVSSTTSEEKCSSILLKITSVNGSRTSQINNAADNSNRVSYKLTEVEDYSANYRPLITKAAKKYIPPLKEYQDLRVKLPLPQQSLDKLKRLKMTKKKPVIESASHRTNHIRHDIPKKIKPKFEDVLRSIDEIQFKMKRERTKKIKSSIPKVVIKKNENGAHYASTPDRKPNFNPDLTGRKWQPWVFIERNEFVDKMAQRNKVKAVYCHRKKTYVLAEKFKKYKSICTAKFVISQPNSDSASTGNLKYTIKLKHNY